MTEPTASRDQLAAELAHWRYAVDALADLDVVASAAAWDGLEHYLRLQVRDRLAQYADATSDPNLKPATLIERLAEENGSFATMKAAPGNKAA